MISDTNNKSYIIKKLNDAIIMLHYHAINHEKNNSNFMFLKQKTGSSQFFFLVILPWKISLPKKRKINESQK